MRRRLIPGALTLAFAVTSPAYAGGLARPNPVSARGVGLSGAFTAVADDPTALWYNPAGLATHERSHIMVGGELVYAPRSYTPLLSDGSYGAPQEPNSPLIPLPSLGFSHRLRQEDVPSRFAFGVGVWATYGGQISYDRFRNADGSINNQRPAIDSTQDAVLEITPGLAFEINDVLAIGASFRVGIGLFDVQATAKPINSSLAARGVGFGASTGIMVTPTEQLTLGAVYRTTLTVETSGEGTLLLPSSTGATEERAVQVAHTQEWPQSAGVSVAYRPIQRLLVAAQLDWVGWSRFEELVVEFPDQGAGLTQRYDLDWQDNYAIHLGTQLAVSEGVEVRGGWTFDSRAVNERTQDRHYADGDKMTLNLGLSVMLTDSFRIDTAAEALIPDSTTIANNSAAANMAGWGDRANLAPGDHEGQLYTLELALQYLF